VLTPLRGVEKSLAIIAMYDYYAGKADYLRPSEHIGLDWSG